MEPIPIVCLVIVGHKMSFLQVLSLRTVGCCPCLAISTENARYLFDCGEGVQRLCVEHRVRIVKLEAIFLTRFSPETMGGLPGVCLTGADAGLQRFSLVGPKGTKRFWNATGHFMRRASFNVDIHEPLSSTESSGSRSSSSCIQKFTDLEIQSVALDDDHLCYICHTPDLPGKFDAVKAAALKIPKGPLYGVLKSGKSITLDDGRVIRSEEVVEDTIPGRYIAIVCDISRADYGHRTQSLLSSLSSHAAFRPFQHNGGLQGRLDCLVHLSPKSVTDTPGYQEWMSCFPSLVTGTSSKSCIFFMYI